MLFYCGMLAVAIGGYYFLGHIGSHLRAPDVVIPFVAKEKRNAIHLPRLFVSLGVVIVCARLVGLVFHRLRQPQVIGEVVAGLLLGPSAFGRLEPELSAYLFPPDVTDVLGLLAQLGVILYMFLVGVELDLTQLRGRAKTMVAISHASIAAPFVMGCALALLLYPRLSRSDVPFETFALFIGVALSVTAFPVLARILEELRINKSPLGVLALTCAAVDDVTAWCLLALVASVATTKSRAAWMVVALSTAYLLLVKFVLRPFLRSLARRCEAEPNVQQPTLAIVVVLLLLSAGTTEAIGIHAVFGAFAVGVVVPAGSKLARALKDKMEAITMVLFIPTFFAYTGLRTQLSLVSGVDQWALCGLIIVVASVAKFGGTFVASRFSGLSHREAVTLGILMNTRGLVELIVLNLGLEIGVIEPTLFAMLVVMAVVTTMTTTPVLLWFDRKRQEMRTPASVADATVSGS
jgi:Kef-type K+ transport system membrane component KefB